MFWKSNVPHNAGLGFHGSSEANACVTWFSLLDSDYLDLLHTWGEFAFGDSSLLALLRKICRTGLCWLFAQRPVWPWNLLGGRHQQELWQSRPELIAARAEAQIFMKDMTWKMIWKLWKHREIWIDLSDHEVTALKEPCSTWIHLVRHALCVLSRPVRRSLDIVKIAYIVIYLYTPFTIHYHLLSCYYLLLSIIMNYYGYLPYKVSLWHIITIHMNHY